jgi:membrane fusion protein (multidrug efflux system)
MNVSHRTIRARRKRYLLLVFFASMAGGLIYAGYWGLHGRHWVVTANAFVSGNLIPVEADATGIVTQVLTEESRYVKKGELLVQLDRHRALTALNQSEGKLGQTTREIGALFATRRQMCQKLIARSAGLSRVRHDVIRLRQAVPNGSVSEQALQNAEDEMAALDAQRLEAEAEFNAVEARVGGTTPRRHPDVETAKHNFIAAYLEYTRQHVYAPASGYVAKRKVQVGNRVQPGDPLLTIIPLDHLWVEANLRETELLRIRPGQAAEIAVDLYGRHLIFHGTVEGLVPGTGSVFALLPPDNATGNFIHIVQRVPVRIALREDEILKNPIRPGLSTVTSIHVEESERPPGDSLVTVSSREYATDIFAGELAEAEKRAEKIIEDNLPFSSDAAEYRCHAGER